MRISDWSSDVCSSDLPVIYGGGGIAIANVVEQFREFVEASQIPTVVTLRALGALPLGHPLLLGMLGMHGSHAANMAVQEADLLIVVGARLDDRATGKLATFPPHARIVHLDGDHGQISKPPFAHLALHGDMGDRSQARTASPN